MAASRRCKFVVDCTVMKAAWYQKQGKAGDVLVLGKVDDPVPAVGEVRVRIKASGINPGDVKKREDAFGYGMPFPRVIPHSDGAGIVDQLGDGVSSDWLGKRVWCYGAQTYRPFGTAAEYTVVPLEQVAVLPESVSFTQGACLGIPVITAHRAVHVAGGLTEKTVLVQGGAGTVGMTAIQFAREAGARVIATVRSNRDLGIPEKYGADHVFLTDESLIKRVKELVPDGVDHVIEVALGANIRTDIAVLAQGGSISTYATDVSMPEIPAWELVFINARMFFVGSDDVPRTAKLEAVAATNHLLERGWQNFQIAAELPLEEIASAHELVEHPSGPGRVILSIPD